MPNRVILGAMPDVAPDAHPDARGTSDVEALRLLAERVAGEAPYDDDFAPPRRGHDADARVDDVGVRLAEPGATWRRVAAERYVLSNSKLERMFSNF